MPPLTEFARRALLDKEIAEENDRLDAVWKKYNGGEDVDPDVRALGPAGCLSVD